MRKLEVKYTIIRKIILSGYELKWINKEENEMKKILRLMALPFILILMFSCNKKEDTTSTDDRQVLKFGAFESGYGADMWRQIISEYEKINPNVKIELNISKDIESILIALIQAEDYPDVVMLSLGRADAIPEHFVKENN